MPRNLSDDPGGWNVNETGEYVTPGDINVILHRLDDLGEKLDETGARVVSIETQAKLTNGRVSELEVAARIAKALAEEREKRRREADGNNSERLDRRATLLSSLGGAVAATASYAIAHLLHWI